MSLRFESVSLKNFGPYREIDTLNLETDSSAPIVLIHGENTLGKTSLFRALRWCLYGSPESGSTPVQAARHLSEYMNRPASRDGEVDMQVSMQFTANGHKYRLVRTARFEGGPPKLSADLRVDSTVIQQASIEAEIGRLLHPQISEFFLFDGELLKDFYDRLNTDRERDLLRDSIDNVLGIPALQLAERDVATLTEHALQKQAKALKNKKDAENARKQMRDLKSRQESLDKDRKEIEDALSKAKSTLEGVKERIAGVEDLKADAREMEGLEALIAGGKQEEEQLRGDMRRLLTTGWLAPAADKLDEALQRVVAKNDAAQKQQQATQVARNRVDVLRKQIRGGICPTCQQELPPPDESTQMDLAEAEAELKRLKESAGDGPDLRLERRIRELIDTATVRAYQQKQEHLDKVVATQFERSRRLNGLKDRLKDNDAARVRQLGKEQDDLEAATERYGQILRNLKPRQDEINKQQDKLAGILRRLGGGAKPEVEAEAFFFEYVRTLLTRTIERYQERTRAEVEKAASEMFVTLVRDPRAYQGLRISRDYRVDLVGQWGEAMKTSEGGKQLVALSLIGALKRAAVRGGPVVLDSPLARLDLEHRANVLKTWVPDLGNQAILLVQSGELTEKQARDIMGNRIGHEYRIYRPSNDPELATIERTQ
ncbi:AAA family ATPase [Micromonospora sp. WMMD714]|uniref:AAA family ATPase n=1 Tax=Micromonospora sp. WMMD714 TaxID=3016097 RepID=UPI002499DAB0|nr:AAA family ATPase [Micromonospora sp. WMMD714]WFE62420.1 AAA family ATPase [Micromonospora sp. WMMD714]